MKILILQDDFPPETKGGAGIVAYNLAKGFLAARYEVSVVTTTTDKTKAGRTETEGLRIYRLFSDYHVRWKAWLSLYNPQTIGKVKEILEYEKPAVVHAHNVHYYLSYHCLRLAKQSGAKVFLTAHDVQLFHYGKLTEFSPKSCDGLKSGFDYRISEWQQFRKFKFRYNPLRNMVIRRYLRYADRIIAVSHALKDALNQNGIRNVEVVHNGIDAEAWQVPDSKVQEFRRKHGLESKKVVLFGGRLSAAKGAGKALDAMQEVANEIPEAVLLVIGQAKGYAEKMKKRAEQMNLGENIIFTGWIEGEDLKVAYHSCDILITPSLCLDSFPTVNLEAMACAKPVVGTCFGGTPEIVQDKKTGFIVNPLDGNTLAGAIVELLKNPEIANMFGKKGLEKISTNYSLKNQASKHLRLYDGTK